MARRAAVAGALGVVMLALAAAAWVVRPDGELPCRVGLNTHLVWTQEAAAERVLRTIRDGGVRWVREELPWRAVEPERGRLDWARTDSLMAAASRSGIDVLGILAYSAPWAASGRDGNGQHPPRDPADYARYAAAVVGRYGRDGTFWRERRELEPRPLRAVEIWNEPWSHATWRPDPDPVAYARLVRAAIPEIRAADSAVEILVAGDLLQVRTDGAIVPWLESLHAADPGLPRLVDAYSVHPYPDPRTRGPYDDRADARWDYRRVELVHELDDSLPIWITEIGWSTAATADSVSEDTQARFVEEAARRALNDWDSFVDCVFIYSFDRDGGDRSDREAHYGLRRADGTTKPAWQALRRLSAEEPIEDLRGRAVPGVEVRTRR